MVELSLKLTIVLILKEITISLVSGNVLLVSQKPPDFAVTTAKIIELCYGDRVKEVGLAGNVPDSFIASLSSVDNPHSFVLCERDQNGVQNAVVSDMDRYKLLIFAIAATSPLDLQKNLDHIKSSKWWNHMAQFYIFDSRNNGKGCSDASEFLWTAWMMDILGAKFICNHGGKGQLIYSFNPYTQHAPAPWKMERTLNGVKNHPWTLFVRKFSMGVNICKNIDFDQTKDAGGYTIRLTMSRNRSIVNPNSLEEFSKLPFGEKLILTTATYMNVTFETVVRLPNESSIGFVTVDGKGNGMLGDLTMGRSDIVYWPWPLTAMTNLLGNYPMLYGSIFAVTQYTGYPSQWEKVISVIDYFSRIGVCIVIVVNVIVLKYVLRQSFMIAILNTIRMICNSCFTRLPNNTGPRIYLTCLFIFVVIIQALFQGNLSALLAKHVRYPNINTKKDLMESHYVLYGRYNDNVIFTDSSYDGRFVEINHKLNKCTDFVLRNSSIACVGIRDVLIKDTIKSRLHMSKNPVAESFMTWLNRKNWPLQDRLTRHNFRYLESGLFDYDQELSYRSLSRTLEAMENEGSEQTYKVLTPGDLDFAFVILVFGLGCAILAFVLEITIFKRKKMSRVRRRIRYRRKYPVVSIEA